jgi:hypothetical protein
MKAKIHGAVIIYACIMLLNCPLVPAQEGQNTATPRLIDEFGDLYCDDLLARLDNVAITLDGTPSSKTYIIGYNGRNSALDRMPHILRFAKGYLIETRGIDERRIVTINGGDREELRIESWLVPEGIVAPIRDETIQIEHDPNAPRKFNYSYLGFRRQDNRYVLEGGTICDLELMDLHEYGRLLRANPNLRAHIIIYAGITYPEQVFGIEGRRVNFRTVVRLLRNILVRDYGMNGNRITISYGGGREFNEMEAWIIPQGASLPRLTPTHHQRRR